MSLDFRLVRTFPRMIMGGAENHILDLLEAIPGTEMVVGGHEGPAALRARELAARYSCPPPPSLAGLVEAMRGADVVHLHVVSDEPVTPLAAQLSGAARIVQTIHNDFAPRSCRLFDHSFLVGVETRELLETPELSSPIPEGVPVPTELGPFAPWFEAGRPLRLLELRRPDKLMACTLAELVATGALGERPVEVVVLGVDGESGDPRVRNLGEVEDVTPWLAWADLVVHASGAETFGRVVYEAMAQGTPALVTPLPAFTERLRHGEQVFVAEGASAGLVARSLARTVDDLGGGGERYARMREGLHRWVAEHASTAAMGAAQREGYRRVLAAPAAPRSVLPDDVPAEFLPALGAVLDKPGQGRPIVGDDLRGLPSRTQGLVFWLLAEHKLVPEAKRLPLLAAAVDALGERFAPVLAFAEAAVEAGQAELAADAFRLAARLHPRVITPWLGLCDLYVRAGERANAVAALESLLQHNPGYEPAWGFLERLRGPARPKPRMFEHLRGFERVVITGPHRSGTTVAAEMIAKDTGFEALREEAFGFYDEARFRELLQRRGVVVQCPALFDLMPAISDERTAVVLMRRPLEELAASRERMFSPVSGRQLSGDEQNEAQLARLGEDGGDAAALKYQRWDRWLERGLIHNPVEITYASLAEHPLWVSPEERRRQGKLWHNRRTTL